MVEIDLAVSFDLETSERTGLYRTDSESCYAVLVDAENLYFAVDEGLYWSSRTDIDVQLLEPPQGGSSWYEGIFQDDEFLYIVAVQDGIRRVVKP